MSPKLRTYYKRQNKNHPNKENNREFRKRFKHNAELLRKFDADFEAQKND